MRVSPWGVLFLCTAAAACRGNSPTEPALPTPTPTPTSTPAGAPTATPIPTPSTPVPTPSPTPTPIPTSTPTPVSTATPVPLTPTPTPLPSAVVEGYITSTLLSASVYGVSVTVTQNGLSYPTSSQSNGYYQINGPVIGPAQIVASPGQGCPDVTQSLQLQAGTNTINILICP